MEISGGHRYIAAPCRLETDELMIKTATCLCLVLLSNGALADPVESDALGTDRLPAWVIELPDSVNDVLIADTSSATMHRYHREGGALQWVDELYMSIGQNGAGKQRAWDKKTPVGTYFITERLDTSKLHDKYGAAAFPLDYPNAWDRRLERTGYGIWLHGVDHNNPDRPPRDTDGCLALRNDALLRIADDLVPLQTPVIVADKMAWISGQQLETTRLEFRFAIDQWQRSVRDGDLLTYLSLYSEDFRHLGMDKDDWSAYRMSVFEGGRPEDIQISDLMLFADPGEQNLFLSRFTQVISSDDSEITTTKRLYWRRIAGNRWQIVSEDNG